MSLVQYFCAAVGVVALLILLSIAAWCIYIRISPFHVKVYKIPGPKFHLPFLGNTLALSGGMDHILEMIHNVWPGEYGEIYRVFLDSQCYIGISSPELLETVFNSQKMIDKGTTYDELVPWLGRGLLLSTGDKWRARRKLLTPAFHFKILNNFVDVFNEQSRILSGILADICQSFQGGKGEVDVCPLLTRCSLDIICEAAMGTKVHAQTEDSEYVKAVYRFAQVIIEKFQQPWLKNPTIFSMTSLGREYKKLLGVLHGFTDKIINGRKAFLDLNKAIIDVDESETGIRNRLALLDLLLKTSEDGNVLTHEDIREEIDTFMFEGHDTISSLLSWFLYCMAENPDCQEEVRTELESVFGDSGRECTQEDVVNMKYLEYCIKETLRLYPSVALFERTVTEDVHIGKYLVPAGCTLACMAYATHRNANVFPDPTSFKPERFSPEQSVGRHPYAYFPFSAGPRNCIGQRFAMLEAKVVLSTLLRRFKFELSTKARRPIPSDQLILKSLTGVNLVVSKR